MRKVLVKLIMCYIVSATAVFVILNTVGTAVLKNSLLQEKKEELYNEACLIADEYVVPYFDSQINLPQMLNQLRVLDKVMDARIWIANSKGVVLADTRADQTVGIIYINQLDTDFLNSTYHENVNYRGVFSENMLSVVEPLMYSYAVRGYVCVHIPMNQVDRETVTYMNFLNICILGLLIILLIVYVVIYIMTVVPIRKIRRAAIEYSKGNFDYQIKIHSNDEYRDLANTVQYMVGEIKNMDDYQKKFIANISHDFRSPLTSIKGFAEAMKDGTIPPEAQNRYLDVILFETDRLTKLTTNLLELNRIDSKGVVMDITTFDINTVIKNTAASFEGICKSKRVVLNLIFAAKETLVDADMSKIQQVLYNLIDNAIKFSEADSQVRVSTEEKGSKVIVNVKDYGQGIAKDSQKKIWDRFYKGDTSRGKDKKGTGLGLSIVKEIITSHEENISVISTEGVGTEFTFTLQRSESM